LIYIVSSLSNFFQVNNGLRGGAKIKNDWKRTNWNAVMNIQEEDLRICQYGNKVAVR